MALLASFINRCIHRLVKKLSHPALVIAIS